MQHNIIDLQNQNDTAYIGNLNQDFILQSLANLGQRVGLKGDGIVYQNFSFYDIFTNITETQYSSDNYIGVIKYDTDNNTNVNVGTAGIIKKGKRYTGTTSFEATADNVNSIISNGTTSTAISSNFIVNNIQSFLPYSVLQTDSDGKYFYNILFAQNINTNDSSALPNIEVHYNKFRLSDNTLDTAIRVINISNTITTSNYLMYVVNRSDDDNLYNVSAYCFKPEIFGDSIINQNIAQRFNNIFYSRTYADALSSFGLTNLSIDDLENPLDNILFFNKIATNNGLTDYHKHSDFTFTASFESNVFKPAGSDIAKLNKVLNAVYSNIDVNALMHYLSNDVNVNFETIFTYFSHNQYNVDIHTLTKKIFFGIYDKIAETDEVSEQGIMYVPLDYKINVIVNSNKQLKFYYSNEFFVTKTNLNSYNDIEFSTFFTNKNNNIVYDYNGLDMINVYNFSFNYNNTYTDLINNLTVKYIYALPSLSSSNTWLINDKDTSIYAVGKDAGNPNIIINYNYEENGTLKYNILNSSDNSVMQSVNWVKTQYYVDNTAIKQYVYVPDVTTNNYKFEYSLIFNINAQTNFISVWHVTDTGFDYIRKPNDNVALNFKKLFDNSTTDDIDNVTVSTLNNALYLTAVDYKIANSFDNISSNFASIKNRSSYFYPTYDVNTPYSNNLNFDIRYKTNFNVNSYNYVENIEKTSTRYMDELMATQNSNLNASKLVTNVIYPSIKTATGVITINKIADKTYKTVQYTTVKNIDTINIITVYGNDNKADNNLTATLNNQIKESLEIIRTSTSNANASFTIETNETTDLIEVTYNEVIKLDKSNFFSEYIPNYDVPTIDLGEVLTRNADILNRVNIIGLDSEGKVYNSYFGTSIDDTDKSHLHIGTSSLNINIGKDTLLSYNNTSYFNNVTELYDDIPTTFRKRTISYCNVNNTGNGFYDSKLKISGDTSYVFGYKNYELANNIYSENINISTHDIDTTKMFLNVMENNKSIINFSNISPIDVDHWNNIINHADIGVDVNTKYANKSVPKEIVFVNNNIVYRGVATTVDGLTTITVSQNTVLPIKTEIPKYTNVKIIKLIHNNISTIDINDCEYCKLNADGNIVFNNVSGTYIICVITNDTDVKFYKICSAANDIISTYVNVNAVFKNLFGIINPQFTDILGLISKYGLDKSKLMKINTTLYYKLSVYDNQKNIIKIDDSHQLYNEYINFIWHDNGTIDVSIDTEHHDFNDDSDNYKNILVSDAISQITFDAEAIKNILGDNKL